MVLVAEMPVSVVGGVTCALEHASRVRPRIINPRARSQGTSSGATQRARLDFAS